MRTRYLPVAGIGAVAAGLVLTVASPLVAGASAHSGSGATASAGHSSASKAASHGNSSKSAGSNKSGGTANAAGGNSNAGDVWTDNVGQPAGPGHEQDPHLACADINLWGNRMADPNGTYTINSWPPTGNQAVVYSSTWQYDTTQGGDQVISVIPVSTLVANATAAGAAPVNKQGLHFKLELSQDPQKHKTFWVDCVTNSPATSNGGVSAGGAGAGGAGGVGGASTGSGGGTGAGGSGAGGGIAPAGATGSTGSGAGGGGVLGITTPATGAALGLGVALLIGGGLVVAATSRRRRSLR